ncbi:UNVERIFIED_CONTAM: hypothetical protein FKN15_052298 [Acipenser sinensis]
MTLLHKVPSVITSTCILHNVILVIESLNDEKDQHVIDEVPCQGENPHNVVDETRQAQRRIAEQKRDEIGNRL